MYYSRSSKNRIIGVVVAVLLVIFIAVPLCSSYFSTKTYTVTVTDKDVKNYSNNSKYLVFTKLENGETKTFSIEDSIFNWRWNSSDVYADRQNIWNWGNRLAYPVPQRVRKHYDSFYNRIVQWESLVS